MATTVIDTPGGIAFSGFYYPEILRETLTFLRQNRDRIGLTDENEFEVHVQLLRAFALVGHLNNVRTDVAATELLIDSAGLLESVKRLLRLVGIELSSASPAAADLVGKLSEVTMVDQTDFIPDLSEFSTDATPPIIYEAITGQDLDRTDQVKYVYGLEETDSYADSTHTLSMSAASPDVITRSAGAWAAAGTLLGQHLFIGDRIVDNHNGEFRVTERLNDTDIRVVVVPGSGSPGFQNDSGIDNWSLKAFTSDFSSDANTDSSFFSPWTDVEAGDMIFVGHRHAFWTQQDMTFNTFAAGVTGVWEYYDDQNSEFIPNSVTDLGSTLEFNVNTLLGSTDRSGVSITVKLLSTGSSETVTSVFAGGVNKITTTGLLGQVTASTDPTDYSVTADWIPFDQQTDNTISGGSAFAADAEVSWDVPETDDRSWVKTEVNLIEAYWSRFRVVSTSTPTEPEFDRIQIDQGDQYVKVVVTQGETIGPQVIGSSTGLARQEFTLPEIPFIDDTETIEVDEGGAGTWTEWTRVESFLSSTTTSRHYIRESDADSKATIRFGDGVNGKIPPAGVNNVRATYRIGGDENGNVGQDQISVNAEGISGISEVFNPRAATGWRIQDGGDTDDLERVKRDSPAELRTRGTATTIDDIKRLAINSFTDSSGIKPVARAFAVEEGFGVKTVKLLVVGSGGSVLTATQLADLDEYFNGDDTAVPPTSGVLVLNHEVTSVNYEPSIVSIDATVKWAGGSAEQIRNQLLAYLTPLALEDDGVTYVWDFGGTVSLSRIHQLIHDVDPNVKDVPVLTINGTAASAVLGENELPVSTAASITINIQE